MNVQLNDSGVPIIKEKTLAQKIKGLILWIILILLTIAAALLVYLCVAGASEMAALTTVKQISDHPYYTMTYENFDYSELLNEELSDNDAVIQYYKNKFFKSAAAIVPGGNENENNPKGSVAFFGRTFIDTYMKGRIYNSYDTPLAMIITKPENGYKAWNIVDLSDVGLQSEENLDQWYSNAFQTVAAAYCVSEGINQEGLSVSLISCPVANCTDSQKANITPSLAVRLMLDRAATVQNAIDVLDGYDIDFSGGAYHFFVSEKTGNSAVIEYVNGKMSVTYPEAESHHQVCSNKMEDTSVSASQKDFGDKYSETSLYNQINKELSSAESSNGSGMAQDYAQERIQRLSSNFTEVSEEYCGTKQYGTLYTVFYDTAKMTMHIVVANDTKTQSYTYDLTK